MWRSQEAARTTKRKTPKCARKIAALLRPFVRGALPMGFPEFFVIRRYFIRLRRRLLRCLGFEERVGQEIPSYGFRDLYESAGQTEGQKSNGDERGGEEDFCSCAGEQDCGHCSALKRLNMDQHRCGDLEE